MTCRRVDDGVSPFASAMRLCRMLQHAAGMAFTPATWGAQQEVALESGAYPRQLRADARWQPPPVAGFTRLAAARTADGLPGWRTLRGDGVIRIIQ